MPVSKHEYSWYLGQTRHNWKFQKLSPRTAREAFGENLDPGHRRADAWVFWAIVIMTVAIAVYLQVQP